MADEVLYSFVNHLMSWIEYLHEKNLKYQAQYESILKDLNDSKSSCEELKARLSAYENSDSNNPQSATINQANQLHHLQQPAITHYQPIASDPQAFVTQQAGPYVWTSGHEMPISHMPVPYYDQQTYNFHQS